MLDSRLARLAVLMRLAVLALLVVAGAALPALAQAPPASEPALVSTTADADIAKIIAEGQRLDATFSEPANPRDKEWVKRKLDHMYTVDQFYRHQFDASEHPAYTADDFKAFRLKLWPVVAELDQADLAALKEILAVHPWITIGEFGAKADNQAWLLVQHADQDVPFQQKVLDTLTTLHPKGETNPRNYAYLWDRVATNSQRPQRYATQGKCSGPHAWEPNAMEDPAHIDEIRASVGLEPLAEYKKMFVDMCP